MALVALRIIEEKCWPTPKVIAKKGEELPKAMAQEEESKEMTHRNPVSQGAHGA